MEKALSCYNCGQNAQDPTGEAQLHRLRSMISDNYLIIAISFILIIVFIILIIYIVKQLINIIRTWRNSNIPEKTVNIQVAMKISDDYDYDDEQSQLVDTTIYMDSNKQDFLNRIKSLYGNYNDLKSKYIKTTYGETNDDVINKDILFRVHDKYIRHENDD